MLTKNLDLLSTSEAFDVCIIGSGFAGTVLGKSLVERGARVVILESGERLWNWVLGRRLKGLAAYEVTGNANYLTKHTKARALGGNSNFWTGRCERYHPSDFQNHAYTPKGCPWPVSYELLEPYYEKAEQMLRVRGGQPSEYAQPRRQPFPQPSSSNISSLKRRLAGVSVAVDESPTATPRRGFRFFRLHKEVLPGFIRAPNCLVLQGATVTRLLTNDRKEVEGAQVRTSDGSSAIAKAKLYVVGCGGIETPRLLLLSRSEYFPNGIGNHFDRVGRGFNEHPGVNFYAKISHDRHTLSPAHRLGRTHQFYDHLRGDGLGSVLPVFIQSWVFPNHLMIPELRDLPRDFVTFLGRSIRPSLYIGATIEMLASDSNRVTLSENLTDEFGDPLAHLHLDFTAKDLKTLDRTRQLIQDIYQRIGAKHVTEGELTWSRHHIGTCRMGDDPKKSVVDRQLKVHECPNLYVCGSETFVTGAAVPPVLTLVALTRRLADHIEGRLQKG